MIDMLGSYSVEFYLFDLDNKYSDTPNIKSENNKKLVLEEVPA
jgi:hypothetical protein